MVSLKRRYKKRSRSRKYGRHTVMKRRRFSVGRRGFGTIKRRRHRRVVSRRAKGMPKTTLPSLHRWIYPTGMNPNVKSAHYKLVSRWSSGAMAFTEVTGTEVLYASAINWNSLVLATKYLDLSAAPAGNRFTDLIARAPDPAGLAALRSRFNATRVVAYRLTMRDLRNIDSLDRGSLWDFALTPVSTEDWTNRFQGTTPNKYWPGTTPNDQWEACLMHPKTKHKIVGNVLPGEGFTGRIKHLSCSVNLADLATDPGHAAFAAYNEYGVSALAAAYREKMVLTAHAGMPDGSNVRNFACEYHEEMWVHAFEPDMPADVLLAQAVGEKAQLDYINSVRSGSSSLVPMDEKEWTEDMLKVEEGAPQTPSLSNLRISSPIVTSEPKPLNSVRSGSAVCPLPSGKSIGRRP